MSNESKTEAKPAPDTCADSGTGAAVRDVSTAASDQTATIDPYLRAVYLALAAKRNRLISEVEENLRFAAAHRARPDNDEECRTLANMRDDDADKASDLIKLVKRRMDRMLEQNPALSTDGDVLMVHAYRETSTTAFMRQAQIVFDGLRNNSPKASADVFLLVAQRANNVRGARTLVSDVNAQLRAMHSDIFAQEPPHATVTFDIRHDQIQMRVALSMGNTISANREWKRQPGDGWRTDSEDLAARELTLGVELAEFADAIDLPTRVANMLPKRRHGADTAEQAAAAVALAKA